MQTVEEVCERGVIERRVALEVGDETVPGIVWLPEATTGPRPTVILGHGGVVHKRAPEVLGLARRLVRHQGYAAVALDAPEHGERITDKEAARARRRAVQARVDQGGPGAGLSVVMDADQRAGLAARMVAHVGELIALVDDLATTGFIDDRLGYWGLSMGTGIGLRFVAAEPRVKAAVLGLAGVGTAMGGAEFEAAARSLRVPILFLLQSDDELIARDAGLGLFDAIGSTDKTLHVNPGGHVQVPVFENDSAESFFVRHLGAGGQGAEVGS
jgi:dienelactone hydrolase